MGQSENNLKNISKNVKNNSTDNFAEKLKMYLKKQKQIWLILHIFQRPVMTFGSFWGTEIIRREYKLRNIRKSLKHILTKNFVGNLNKRSKGPQTN